MLNRILTLAGFFLLFSGSFYGVQAQGAEGEVASEADQKEVTEAKPVESEGVKKEGGDVHQGGKGRKGHKGWQKVKVIEDEFIKIGKVHEFLNDPDETNPGKNKALQYEFKYFNYGAITKAQKEALIGKHFVVNWENKGPEVHLTLRLEYLQEKSRDEVKVLEIEYPHAKGKFKGRLGVTGSEYRKYGQVLAWRLSLVRDGNVVAERRSFIW